MAFHNRPHFTFEGQQFAAIAKALGYLVRITIVRLPAQRQACVCGELALELLLSQSTVLQHLKELKAAGLGQGKAAEAHVCYFLMKQARRPDSKSRTSDGLMSKYKASFACGR